MFQPRMAGVLEEFDDATPLKGTFCSRLSLEEYEEEASSCTKRALEELMDHLDDNPDDLKAVLSKRRKDAEEEKGIWSFVKMKLMTLFKGDAVVSDDECQQKLESLKIDMMKAFNYAQESKGRRYSRRLAEREMRRQLRSQLNQENQSPQLARLVDAPLPPPPAPPPPPPLSSSAQSTPVKREPLTRRPLTERREKNISKIEKKQTSSKSHDQLLQQLKSSECRKRLRKTARRSPGRTPLAVSKKYEPDLLPFFNAKLSEKFRNTVSDSPEHSPGTLASPGAFGSPM